MPAGEVRTKLKAAVPLAAAVPDDRAKEFVCAKESDADNRKAIAKINAMAPREDIVIKILAKSTGTPVVTSDYS